MTICNQEENRKLEAQASRKNQLCRRPCLELPFLLFVNALFRAILLLFNVGVEGALFGEMLASCAQAGAPAAEPTAAASRGHQALCALGTAHPWVPPHLPSRPRSSVPRVELSW